MPRKKRDDFTFPGADIPIGAEIEPSFCLEGKPVVAFWQRKGEVVKVADDKHVWCDGILISFSKLTGDMLKKLGRKRSTGDQPSRFWKYDGEKLDRRYERICILREAKQGGHHA